jgi:hypothetical protein
MLMTLNTHEWDATHSTATQSDAIQNLEQGQILYLPNLAFSLLADEQVFLSPTYADPHAKNIGYYGAANKLWGVQGLTDEQHLKLKGMLDRFSRHALGLIHQLLPAYAQHLIVARTSYRPVQVSDRKTSYRKDDKRLHVDAFPSAPNQGKRILRVFCNINPNGEDRVWRTGEPFVDVAAKFVPQIKKPFPGSAAALRFLRITKSYRSAYDHYMLQIHDRMKADERYQQEARQQEVRFASGSSWIVQTDHVSHAAMSGQYLLEQTFYLPVTAMQNQQHSPLRVLEKMLNQPLT